MAPSPRPEVGSATVVVSATMVEEGRVFEGMLLTALTPSCTISCSVSASEESPVVSFTAVSFSTTELEGGIVLGTDSAAFPAPKPDIAGKIELHLPATTPAPTSGADKVAPTLTPNGATEAHRLIPLAGLGTSKESATGKDGKVGFRKKEPPAKLDFGVWDVGVPNGPRLAGGNALMPSAG
jgi:hypothetical protein